MKDKYIIAITVLSILLVISLIINGWLVAVVTDLRDTTMMYENSLGVCRIDLEKVQIENDEIRHQIGVCK